MAKTVVVKVERLKKHSKYLKYFKASTRFKAHADNAGEYQVGDTVLIEETRPLSKDKRWKVVKVVRRSAESERADAEDSEEAEP